MGMKIETIPSKFCHLNSYKIIYLNQIIYSVDFTH